MRIGIAFDLAPAARAPGDPDDRYEEYDKPTTIDALASVLEAGGHRVDRLGDGRAFLGRVLESPPDLVWNLAEGEGVGRCREARVPAALEMLGIPYTGSDPLTLAAALDKDVAKRLVAAAGVAVPRGLALVPGPAKAAVAATVSAFARGVPFPWLIKPAFEGSSKGIRTRCLVDREAEALALVSELARDYGQTVLIEEFIEGDEVTVGIVGNDDAARILGTMRVVPLRDDGRFVYSLEMKREWSDHLSYEIPARLTRDRERCLAEAALGSFRALGCRDLARIDFRFRGGLPYFIEANPLPGLAPDWSDLVILARGMGLDYPALIGIILEAASTRLGLAGTATGEEGP